MMPNRVLKRTAGELFSSRQPLSAGSGLARRSVDKNDARQNIPR